MRSMYGDDSTALPFTPELSDELWQRVVKVYTDDIGTALPQLRLQRLIDLLEHTEWLYELYLSCLGKDQNMDALGSFINGCFYVYLVMPQSIQFHTRNRAHTVYSDVRALYESQVNMTNVLLMVKEEVQVVLESQWDSASLNERIPRNRAYSVPDEARVVQNLDKLTLQSPTETRGGRPRSQKKQLLQLPRPGNVPVHSDSEFIAEQGISLHGDDSGWSDLDDQSSPLWRAPQLEPNDQLKLAAEVHDLPPGAISRGSDADEEEDVDDLEIGYEEMGIYGLAHHSVAPPQHAPPPVPLSSQSPITSGGTPAAIDDLMMRRRRTHTMTQMTPAAQTVPPGGAHDRSFKDFTPDRSLTHRKNSYHSVYMLEESESSQGNLYYDESNAYIQSLERLQKQSIITAPELFSILSNEQQSKQLLLIDLRLDYRYNTSKIIAPNTVHIDPKMLWNSNSGAPMYEITELESKLNNPLFNRRDEFDYVVYFSDMKTFMKLNFDYHFTFFYLLNTARGKPLKCVPTVLLGGYEKWKKVILEYGKQYNICVTDYLVRITEGEDDTPARHDCQELPYRQQNFAGINGPGAVEPWKPHEVPATIRKRPPPPPPASVPQSPDVVPVIPPRIMLDSKVSQHRAPFQSNLNFVTGQILEADEDTALQVAPTKRIQQEPFRSATNGLHETYSIPTIEQNPNIYVSLSITGLRNLGNTCYINSMIQCLFATKSFRNLFISMKYKEFLKEVAPKPGANGSQPVISRTFYILFKKMYLNGGCSVVPISFLKSCSLLRPDFKIPDDQQDTTEFLMLILDRLHDELSNQDAVVNEYPDLILYDEKKLNVQNKEYKKWFDKSVIGNGLSPIDDIFQGQMENSLHCQRCGHSSFNYSTFYVLSLAIPKATSSTFSRSKRVSLEECLNMYTSDEVLSGENAWDCPNCCKITKDYKGMVEKTKRNKAARDTLSPGSSSSSSKKGKLFSFSLHHRHHHRSELGELNVSKINRSLSPFRVLGGSSSKSVRKSEDSHSRADVDAQRDIDELREMKEEMKQWKSKKLFTIKTLNFIRMPRTLIIHLSRFYYDLTKKNSTIVTYPLILNIVLKSNEVVKYKLYGVVNHTGNLISGHYTSIVDKQLDHSLNSNGDGWYYFDDEVVKRETRHGDVKHGVMKISSSDVYVLFYERI
ncbi:ubiquitin-specific protease UBP7 KNAG_0L02200 [Huiozyma naganishii CBS 8797]|uniref:ubiquitinyl hydrolase 1 n=1 Tax=Huiozyma naganishii (strain ATCC MYA-139 / BCRC 22969 / CBS 8797 / KCTC 17520 / NBRC 10181 / NCYC 3082 / Yp74L-3) TaxID=1071383 RepID=J7S3V1_HUIN7|nr:hypothetical protein KNAG_0L02200 [Kazachstania naganishii CBS 8797]CCK72837.1 hypothetical protein KNAG_0L02200 [Kazachstania naganishii CBS 8797]